MASTNIYASYAANGINSRGEIVGTRSFRGDNGMVLSGPWYWGTNPTATIADATGRAVRNSWGAGNWSLPNGTTLAAGAYTDSRGTVKFSTTGPRGLWRFTVTDVVRSGCAFDGAGSVLSATRTY
jgi:hypothetical protein